MGLVEWHPFWSEMRPLNRGRFLAQDLAPKRCPPTVGGHSLWPIFWSRTRPLMWCRVSVSVQTLVRRQWRGSSYIALSCILKYRCCFPIPFTWPLAHGSTLDFTGLQSLAEMGTLNFELARHLSPDVLPCYVQRVWRWPQCGQGLPPACWGCKIVTVVQPSPSSRPAECHVSSRVFCVYHLPRTLPVGQLLN